MKRIALVSALLSVLSAAACVNSPAPRNSNQQPTKQDIGLLPEIKQFLETHKEFGSPIKTQPIPDWAKGKRQRVTFDNGRDLLFYTQNNTVVTVYEDTSDGRKAVWGETSK